MFHMLSVFFFFAAQFLRGTKNKRAEELLPLRVRFLLTHCNTFGISLTNKPQRQSRARTESVTAL